MKKENTYNQQMHCTNCGISYIKSFSKGEASSGHHQCPNCECYTAVSRGMPIKDWIIS